MEAKASDDPPNKKMHIVAVPYPAQGHITPLYQLCTRLVPLGFHITFVNTFHNHSRILRSHPFSHLHGIRPLAVPGGSPPELHGFKDTSRDAFLASQEMAEPFNQLLSSLMHENPPVSFILSDLLLKWAHASASKYGMPWVAFWSASAATLSALSYFSSLVLQGDTALLPEKHSDSDSQNQNVVSGIPGLPPTHQRDLPIVFDDTGKLSPFLIQHVLSQFHRLTQHAASYVLVNSFSALERDVLDALASKIRILPVGPLVPSEMSIVKTTRPSLFLEDDGCLAWLETQKPGSVLYISFGSISVRPNDQLLELAMGLEASENPFLWVLRPNPVATGGDSVNATDSLEEFTSRTKGRGVVVPWVSQLEVLAHASVGGFMTHCGWNSVVESVAMGVAMLCWADSGERRSNQRFVVDEWKVGMKVSSSEELIGRGELEKVVREFMSKEEGASIRRRAEKLKRSAMAALAESPKHLLNFSHILVSSITTTSP